jgi:hypothetical protein
MAFNTLAVMFMDGLLEMSSMQIGINFLVVLTCSIPGAKLEEFVTHQSNPNTSRRLSQAFFFVVTAVASAVLSGPERQNICCVFCVFWGLSFGW